MKHHPNHEKNLMALKRIEGQIRGIQKMVNDRKYCVDILNQVHAVIGALASVEEKILEKHFEHCVTNTVKSSSLSAKKQKLSEILHLIHRFRRI